MMMGMKPKMILYWMWLTSSMSQTYLNPDEEDIEDDIIVDVVEICLMSQTY